MIKVREIFHSIQGEGVYQGIPMVFVRLQGCNLLSPCIYCDTLYSRKEGVGDLLEVEEVIDRVVALNADYLSWVCITGGEPLWQLEEVELLVRELRKRGYRITIETNGSFLPPKWHLLVDSWCVDIKCPSSGNCGVSSHEWLKLKENNQVKLVVGTQEDLDYSRKIIETHRITSSTILVSPVLPVGLTDNVDLWGKDWLQVVAEFCKKMRVRYSLQLHKVIWGSKRGV